MSIDGTSNPADDQTQISAADNGDRRAEQADGQQTDPDDDRGHRRAETLTREEYADAMRADGPPIRQESPDAFQSPRGGGSYGEADIEGADDVADRDRTARYDGDRDDGDAVSGPDLAERADIASSGSELGPAEISTRDQHAHEMRDGPSAMPDDAPDHEHEAGHEPETTWAGTPAGDRELAEPRSRQEVAEEARADGGPFPSSADGDQRGEADPADADGQDRADRSFSVVQADRTLGDTTPTGIGLKPTGEQLRDMESDQLSRADRFRKNVYERADDIKDVTEKNAGTLQGLLGAHGPTGHEVTMTTEPAIETSPLQPLDAGSIAAAGLVVGVLADRAIHWAREWLRRPKG